MSQMKVGVFVDAENIKFNGGYNLRYDVLRRFAARNGGYTRALHWGFRRGDAAPVSVVQLLVEKAEPEPETKGKKKKAKTKGESTEKK